MIRKLLFPILFSLLMSSTPAWADSNWNTMTWNSSNWATPCNLSAECDDGLFCNGAESCVANVCQAGTSPVIDDGVGCTIDTCDETLDTVVHAPNDTACSDGTFCNGAEVCNPVSDCQAGTPLVLDDGSACTTDTCDEAGATILHTPLTVDSDSDGVPDCSDVCPGFNDSLDADADGIPDGCDAQTCGNGIIEGTEECDDNNLENWDSCSVTCTTNRIIPLTVSRSYSIIDTTGGPSGTGVGSPSIFGNFEAIISGGQIKLKNISVLETPSSGFVFPEYVGTYNAVSEEMNGAQDNAPYPENNYTGSLELIPGDFYLCINGNYSQPVPSGVNFQYSIIAGTDTDGDGRPDMADDFPNDPTEWFDSDVDGVGDHSDPFPSNASEWMDTDSDGVGDNQDNCPTVANTTQTDTDHDAKGDVCDSKPSTANYGSVIDAPHNETRGVKCVDCHTYTLWWQHSPASASTATDYASITNAVCAKCHSNETHSSVTPGGFSVKCVDCHSAHDQAQVDWRTNTDDASNLYLVKGTITGTFIVSGGKTTFNYSLVSSLSGWSNVTMWGEKDISLPPSGLILVVDTTNATNTYEVLSATSTTITIKGGIDPNMAGKSFGLVYGQMIKKTIVTAQGNKDVKFFNPKKPGGGYTDSNTPVTGICQVCHTTSLYWTSDGSNTGHQPSDYIFPDSGLNCIRCHTMAGGFKAP